jgi:hypothetical protein
VEEIMRQSVWLLPAALLLAGPVASALSQGCPGIVSRNYTQPKSATPQGPGSILYQGPITQPSQPATVEGATAAGQPTVIYPGPDGGSSPMMVENGGQPMMIQNGSQPMMVDNTNQLKMVQPPAPARPGLFNRLFHRNSDPAMSSGPSGEVMMEPNVIVMPASTPTPAPATLPAPAARPMPAAPAMGPSTMNSVPAPQRTNSAAPMPQVLHRESSPASPSMPYVMTSSGPGSARYIVLPETSEMPPATPAQPAARPAVQPAVMKQTSAAKPTQPASQPTIQPVVMMQATPAAARPVVMHQTASTTLPVPVDFPIKSDFIPKVKFDSDYSFLTGQLYHVHAEDVWVVRYAPAEVGDRNGGLVVLETSANMKGFHEGDLITVHGSLGALRNGSMINAPLYKAERVELVEHGEP